MSGKNIIAIDGQSYVGKSTTSDELAKLLGCVYINTGLMYRAVASKSIEQNIDYTDKESIINIVSNIKIEFTFNSKLTCIIVNGVDYTYKLDSPRIVTYASKIAAISEVRDKLTDIQRTYGNLDKVIFEGRDIGTVIFPNASWKFFIQASLNVRARRMRKSLIEKNPNSEAKVEDLMPIIKKLDKNDTTREIAPLAKAKDAIIYDNSNSPSEIQDALILQYYIYNSNELIKNAGIIKKYKL